MPDFDAIVAGAVTTETWDDHPPTGGVSRLNPLPAERQRYYRCTVGAEVFLVGIVGSTMGPLDADLGGRLFTSDFGERACEYPIAATSPSAQSSIQRWTPRVVGHYLWFLRRPGGGAIGFHIDVEAA